MASWSYRVVATGEGGGGGRSHGTESQACKIPPLEWMVRGPYLGGTRHDVAALGLPKAVGDRVHRLDQRVLLPMVPHVELVAVPAKNGSLAGPGGVP